MEDRETITIRLSPDLKELFEEYCVRRDQTVSAMIRFMIEEKLNDRQGQVEEHSKD